MDTNTPATTRPPLESLACVDHRCDLYGQMGQGNLTVRKVYGKDAIRFLRCTCCGAEFSERKATALWNTKVSEAKAEAVAEHLGEGCSLKASARLAKVDVSVVRRLNRKVAEHGGALHDERAQDLRVEALEADERHGYVHDKGQPQWEAELIDPVSKFVVSHVQGPRDEALIRRLLSDGASRLANPQRLVLLTDGEASYASLFPEILGQPYRPARRGSTGAFPHCAIASRVRSLMSRSLSTTRAAVWWMSLSVMRMARGRGFTRPCTRWATPSRTPRPLNGAMAPPAG